MKIKMCENFVDELPESSAKAIMLQTPEHLREVEEMLKPQVKDVYMTRSKPFFLEFMNKSVNKGSSLERLCEILNVDTTEVIAIGDSYNDISMIKVAGIGIAMGNAVDELKEISDYITDTNINNGVSKAVNKFILNID